MFYNLYKKTNKQTNIQIQYEFKKDFFNFYSNWQSVMGIETRKKEI